MNEPMEPATRDERSKPKLVQRLEERRERYEQRGMVYRAIWVTAGLLLTLGGLALLVLPGPAFLIIPVGLAMLSLQFAWAASLLERALDRAEVAKEKAAQTSTTQRVLTFAAGLLAAAAAVAVVLYFDIDVPVVPWF